MTLPARLHHYSFRDYLAVEEMSTVKHEFLDGEIYAMAGGSPLHAALSAAVAASLIAQLRGRCGVYSSDLRIRVAATGLTSYPDVTVVCGDVEPDPENGDTALNPSFIVEVLSLTTFDYDLGEKFDHFRRISSLIAAAFVSQDQRRIELRQRTPAGEWRARAFGRGDTVAVPGIDCVLDVDRIYGDARSPI